MSGSDDESGGPEDLTPDEAFDYDAAEEADDAEAGGNALPPKLEAWRRRSATGAILTGFALGLQQALEPKREEPGIMIQTSGDPPKDLPVEAEFEYRRPKGTVVNIRPWLLEQQTGDDPDDGAPTDQDKS